MHFMRRVLVHSLLSLLVAVAIISCSSKSSVSLIDGVVTIDVPAYENDSTQMPSISQLFDTVNIVLETGGIETLIGGTISDIKICCDTLIIFSDNVFQLFDMNGRFIRKIDRLGRGPGEYTNIIRHFEVDEEKHHIIVFDRGIGIMRYTLSGKFVNIVRYEYDALDFALMPDGGYVLFSPFAKTPHGGLWTIDARGNFKRNLISYDDYEISVIVGSHWLTHVNDTIIGFPGLEDIIYHVTNDTVYPVYQINSEIIDPNEVLEEGKILSYYKENYLESDRLVSFNLDRITAPHRFVKTVFDKKNGQSTYLFTASTFNHPRIPADNRFPNFLLNQKEYFFNELSTYSITNNDELKAKYPGITEESNPIIQIFRSK
jgi:hypothetical protein